MGKEYSLYVYGVFITSSDDYDEILEKSFEYDYEKYCVSIEEE